MTEVLLNLRMRERQSEGELNERDYTYYGIQGPSTNFVYDDRETRRRRSYCGKDRKNPIMAKAYYVSHCGQIGHPALLTYFDLVSLLSPYLYLSNF